MVKEQDNNRTVNWKQEQKPDSTLVFLRETLELLQAEFPLSASLEHAYRSRLYKGNRIIGTEICKAGCFVVLYGYLLILI